MNHRLRLATWLVARYPAAWRRDGRDKEMLEMLAEQDLASCGRLPTSELVDLGAHAIGARWATVLPAAARRRVATLSLVTGTGLAVGLFMVGEWRPWRSTKAPTYHSFGPFLTDGPVIYLPFVAMCVAGLIGLRRTARVLAVIGAMLTIAAVAAAEFMPVLRPTVVVVLAMGLLQIGAALGLDVLARSRGRWRIHAGLATVVSALVITLVLSGQVYARAPDARWSFYLVGYGELSGLHRLQVGLPIALVAALLAAALASRIQAGWLSAAAVASLPWILLAAPFTATATPLDAKYLAILIGLAWAVAIAAGRLAITVHQRRTGTVNPSP